MAEVQDHSELLSQFEDKLAEFERFRGFIEKAEAQASRFAPEVVQKVVTTNQEKMMAVATDLVPLTMDLEGAIDARKAEVASIQANNADAKIQVEEMELRLAIGEMEQEAFDAEASSLKESLASAEERIGGLEAAAAALSDALERWNTVGTEAGVLTATPTEDNAVVELEPEPEMDGFEDDDGAEETVDDILNDVSGSDEEDDLLLHDDGEGDEDAGIELGLSDDEGVHIEQVGVVEDLSVVFEEDEDDGNLDDLLGEEIDNSLPGEDLDEDLALGAAEADQSDAGGAEAGPRRAVLLIAEGTPEEQVHPVTKDAVSIGRGRDNDIQVRNDSKVSRYHCKVTKQGADYFIIDNQSANGSLVNGELVTERRLFGGEEIIIGETFFRFRIMD